jgi:pimeloyl-ACP methyl ester carboxylesterase
MSVDVAAYRAAEAALWSAFGREPSEEHHVRLPATGTSVRVQEVGEGPPALFLHGGPNAGSTWVPLVTHLDGLRCLLVDRPGTGLSAPYPITASNLHRIGARFVPEVLDGLGIGRSHVVASSFGGHLALRSAAAHPDRFLRMVQMAAPALVPGDTIPPFMRLMVAVEHPTGDERAAADRACRSRHPAADRARHQPRRRPHPGRRSSPGTSRCNGTPTPCATTAR